MAAALTQLSAQTLQKLSSDEKARFIEYTKALALHADEGHESRASAIPQYTTKASFHIRCLRIRSELPAPELRNPFDRNKSETCGALSNFQETQPTAPWLHGFCLGMMRGLNFLGDDINGEHCSKEPFIEFILAMLDFPQAAAEQLQLPAGGELVALTRYKFASRLRMLGRKLQRKGLVHKAASGQIIWDHSCDRFNNLSWTWDGHWPTTGDRGGHPAVPAPGFMLRTTEVVDPDLKAQVITQDMDVDGPPRYEDGVIEGQACDQNPGRAEAMNWGDALAPAIADSSLVRHDHGKLKLLCCNELGRHE